MNIGDYRLFTSDVVSLKVYDILGREVATLVDGKQNAGNYRVEFNGGRLGSGVYFYRLEAGKFVEQRKMILMK
ncbi:MAG: T9SS type A sorting domain-containing protein [Bacteroidota bacterium]